MASVQQPADLTLNKYSLEYSYEELERATCNFDASCKLGSGGFGAVYHGMQSDGTDVAVKALDMPEEAGFEEEVRVLSRFRHPNLVILMGFARHGSQRFLVYELLEGGDVHRRLEKSNSEGLPFPWRQRVSSAFDAACGLSHLHNSTPKVFHRDIKSPNILLDRNGTAKMADFGLACLSHAKAHRVENAAGTVGYACPLYARRCVVTEGSEVYSFGVVLLELLTASPPAWIVRSPDGTRNYEFLAAHINGDIATAMALADPGASWPDHVAFALGSLALHCIQADDEQRPCFTDVVRALRRLRDAPDSCAKQDVGAKPEAQALGRALRAGAHAPEAVPVRQQVASPEGQESSEMPKLWSLECEFVEGLDAIPSEHRVLSHRQEPNAFAPTRSCCRDEEPGAPLLTLFKVGRLPQEEFFQAVFAEEGLRNMVSREHFQIWATQAADAPVPANLAAGGLPCSFFVANLSRSWTMVNGMLLDTCGQCVQLHNGDRITLGRKMQTSEGVSYSPLVQFRFDLAGSVLSDADASQVVPVQSLPVVAQSARTPRTPALVMPAMADMRRATSFVGDVVPQFLLEVGGTGVVEDAEGARRLIAHGRALQARTEKVDVFAPLVLGTGLAASFWQRLLSQEALSAMALEHVAFEPACLAAGAEALQVSVRSCSPAHPVFLCTTVEQAASDRARMLEPGERWLLQSGDLIVIVSTEHCSVWLKFWDMTAFRGASVAGGA